MNRNLNRRIHPIAEANGFSPKFHSKMLLVKIKPKHYDITLIRFGSVKGDIGDTIVGYTSVKSIKRNGDIVLDRVRTRPKKGIDYKVLD